MLSMVVVIQAMGCDAALTALVQRTFEERAPGGMRRDKKVVLRGCCSVMNNPAAE